MSGVQTCARQREEREEGEEREGGGIMIPEERSLVLSFRTRETDRKRAEGQKQIEREEREGGRDRIVKGRAIDRGKEIERSKR